MPPVEENPGSPIWDWLWKIFSTLILLLVAAGLVYLIVRLFARLYQSFYHKDDGDGDRKEFIRPTDRTDKVRRETKAGLGLSLIHIFIICAGTIYRFPSPHWY